MHETTSPPKPSRKIGFYLLLNVVLALVLLAAVPLLRTGQESYEPHAVVDREYVKNVIASGETEEVSLALKLTEISRAVAYDDYVKMLVVMQVLAVFLALVVAGNILILARMRQNDPAPSPANPGPVQ